MKSKILFCLVPIFFTVGLLYAAEQQAVLNCYLDMSDMVKAYDEINARFQQQYPGIKLQIESTSDEWEPVFRTKIATGETPDVFHMYPANIEFYASQNIFMDLTDQPYMTNIAKNAKIEMSLKGRVYSMPLNAMFVGLFYNADIYAKYGLKIPRTWSEFLVVCDTLKRNGVIPIVLPYKDDWMSMNFIRPAMSSLLYTRHPNFDNDVRSGKDSFTNPEMIKIFERFIELRDKKYIIDDALGISTDQAYLIMTKGQAAMMFDGSWGLAPMLELNPKMNLGYIPVPVVDDVNDLMATSNVEQGLAIFKQTKYPDAANKYLSFFLEPEIYKLYITANKGASVVTSINVSGDKAFDYIQNFVKMGKTHTMPNFVPDTWIPFRKITQQIYLDQYSIQDGLREYQRVIEEKLKQLQ